MILYGACDEEEENKIMRVRCCIRRRRCGTLQKKVETRRIFTAGNTNQLEDLLKDETRRVTTSIYEVRGLRQVVSTVLRSREETREGDAREERRKEERRKVETF